MKILAVGDIHLGRTPSRLPSDLSPRELGPAEAWRRTVEVALEAEVAAVLLAGDVVDRTRTSSRRTGSWKGGVRRVADEGIAVIGVVGNHDVEVLPASCVTFPAPPARRRGQWESCRIAEGEEAVTLWGWYLSPRPVRSQPPRGPAFRAAPRHQPGPAALRP